MFYVLYFLWCQKYKKDKCFTYLFICLFVKNIVKLLHIILVLSSFLM